MSAIKIFHDNVIGHLRELSNGRLVFVGHSEGHPNRVFIATRNADGEDLYLAISKEGAEVLRELLGMDQLSATAKFPHRPRLEWQVVR